MEKTSLYFKDGSSDKEYHVTLDGGTVTVQYGRRGNALTSLTKCENCEPDKAMKVYQKLIQEKKAKGYHPGEDGVQYSAPVDANQTGYRPQLLNEINDDIANQLIQNDDWLMQEKEDGRNIGILIKNGKAIASNKRGLQIAIPERIINDLQKAVPFDVTLCGELVGDVFKVWDIINFKDMEEDYPTYMHRFKLLIQLINIWNCYNVKLTKTAMSTDEKVALYEEMFSRNAEGVVFKRKDSLYTPGRPASGGDHLKYKFTATCSVIAGKQNTGKRSVEMWLYDGDDVENVGNVTIYPNQEIPQQGDIIEVRYLYAFPGGSLFQPVFLGVRDDVTHDECTMSQLKFKREMEEE